MRTFIRGKIDHYTFGLEENSAKNVPLPKWTDLQREIAPISIKDKEKENLQNKRDQVSRSLEINHNKMKSLAYVSIPDIDKEASKLKETNTNKILKKFTSLKSLETSNNNIQNKKDFITRVSTPSESLCNVLYKLPKAREDMRKPIFKASGNSLSRSMYKIGNSKNPFELVPIKNHYAMVDCKDRMKNPTDGQNQFMYRQIINTPKFSRNDSSF